MWWRNRKIILGAIALLGLFVMLVVGAPRSQNIDSGSTYNYAPEGYAAWFAQRQSFAGAPVYRWQKSPKEFKQAKLQGSFLQVNFDNAYLTGPEMLTPDQKQWVEQGNTWIVLGVRQPVTKAAFSSRPLADGRLVKVETTRRLPPTANGESRPGVSEVPLKPLLADQFGTLVWEQPLGKGRMIFSVTPHLGANAYRGESGNFAWLNQLTGGGGNSAVEKRPLWVDEYLHGHKDTDVVEAESEGDWIVYLSRTGLTPALAQVVVVSLVALWGLNRRFGQAQSLPEPQVDNSQAYIQAMSEVLLRAERSEFVWEMVGKQERQAIQQALGLGHRPVAVPLVVQAWEAQTGRSARELLQVLEPPFVSRRASESELLTWLELLKGIRASLPK